MSITAQFVQEMKTKKSKKQAEIVRIDAAIESVNALGCKDTTVEKPKQTRKTKTKKSRRPRLVPDSQNGLIRNIIRDDGPMTAKEAHKRVSGMTLHGVQCVISRLMQRKYLRNDGKKPATYRAV
jgi:hypothetical protein